MQKEYYEAESIHLRQTAVKHLSFGILISLLFVRQIFYPEAAVICAFLSVSAGMLKQLICSMH